MGSRFEGRVVAITGAASGIGAATARRFADEGARLALTDRNEEAGAALAKELGEGSVHFEAFDIRERERVEGFLDGAAERFGRLDVLINNAGIGAYGLAPDLDPETWHEVIDVDLNAVYYGCRGGIPHLRRAGGGAIVNTASISGLYADYGLGVYNAAKGAVVNYTRAVAIDHAHEGIRVNCVCPGPIETPLATPLLSFPGLSEEYERLIPMGRVGRAEEVAGAIAFLASDDASYVTGAALVVDGGITASTGQPHFTRFLRNSTT